MKLNLKAEKNCQESANTEGKNMFCPNCGNQVSENQKFCPACGAKIDSLSTSTPELDVQGEASEKKNVKITATNDAVASEENSSVGSTGGKSKKKFPAKLIGIVAGAAAVAVFGGIAVGTYKPTVDASKYLTVSYSGYDTVGKASVTFDIDSFKENCKGKVKLNKKCVLQELEDEGYTRSEAEEYLKELLGYYEEMDEDFGVVFLSEELSHTGSLDESSSLKNGDIITYSWDGITDDDLEDIEKAFGCKIKCDPIEFTVEGLEEVGTYDPFENISVTFSGVAPNGVVEIKNNAEDDMGRNLQYSVSKSEGLSNGDEITITVNDANSEYFATNYGKIPSPTERSYTVEGLQHYLSSADEITADILEEMKEQANDIFSAYHANESETEILRGEEYLGTYVLSQKSEKYNEFHNAVYLVYRVDMEDYEETRQELYDQINTYYTLCRFDNLMVTDGGEITVDLSEYSSPATETYAYQRCTFSNKTNGFYYNGYSSLDDLYKDVIQSQSEMYKIENNVKDVDTSYEATHYSTMPEEALEYNGHYYLAVNVSGISWNEAKAHCEEKGGHLATITSEDESAWIIKNLKIPQSKTYWLGATRDSSQNWSWITGEQVDFSNWEEYSPYDFENCDYMFMLSKGTWSNAKQDNSSKSGYIIEWDGTTEEGQNEEKTETVSETSE